MGSRSQLFVRLVARSISSRGLRTGAAVAAVTLAAAVTAALGNLQAGLRVRLERELAGFGPNILITQAPSGGGHRKLRDTPLRLMALQAAAARRNILVSPYRRSQATVRFGSSGKLIVPVHAVDPAAGRRMNSGWQVTGDWLAPSGEAMAGTELAQALHIQPGSSIRLLTPFPLTLRAAGVLSCEGNEDRELLVSLADMNIPGKDGGRSSAREFSVDGAEVRADGDLAQVTAVAAGLQADLPGVNVHVLQRVAQADTLVLARLERVFGILGLVIVIASGLCVSTTFSTMVLQRSPEIGLQKALGASDSEVVAVFWGEALCLGALGSVLGYAAGIGFAAWIGQAVFQSPVRPQWGVLPAVLLVALGMTFLAAVPSALRIARLEPVVSLKGSTCDIAQ